jgi:hypothetical protein
LTIHLNLITHGLGNNLFMLSAGLQLSLITGSELICYERLEIRGTKNSISGFAETLEIELIHGLKSESKGLTYYNEVCPYCFDQAFNFLPKNTILNGYFQNSQYHTNSKDDILKGIVRTSEVLGSSTKSSINDVSIQIRLGDFKNKIIRKKIGLLSYEYFRQSLNSIKFEPDSSITVFSDSINEALSLARENISQNLNFDMSREYETPLGNLTGLALSRNLIISNSTFGWWAAQLSEYLQYMNAVVAPEFWSRSQPCSRQMSNSDWIKLTPKWR